MCLALLNFAVTNLEAFHYSIQLSTNSEIWAGVIHTQQKKNSSRVYTQMRKNNNWKKKLNRVSTLRSVKSIYMMIIAQLSKVLKSSPIVCGCRGSIFTSLKVSRRFCGLFDGLSSF